MSDVPPPPPPPEPPPEQASSVAVDEQPPTAEAEHPPEPEIQDQLPADVEQPPAAEIQEKPPAAEAQDELPQAEADPPAAETLDEKASAQDQPAEAESEDEPPEALTHDQPAEAEAEEELPEAEIEEEAPEAETDDEPAEAESGDEPPEAETEEDAPEAETENEPAEAETEDEPPEAETDDEPAEAETEDEPREAETDDEPPEAETETEPPETETETEPGSRLDAIRGPSPEGDGLDGEDRPTGKEVDDPMRAWDQRLDERLDENIAALREQAQLVEDQGNAEGADEIRQVITRLEDLRGSGDAAAFDSSTAEAEQTAAESPMETWDRRLNEQLDENIAGLREQAQRVEDQGNAEGADEMRQAIARLEDLRATPPDGTPRDRPGIPVDDGALSRADLPSSDDADFRSYTVAQQGGLELVQLQVEGPVGEIDKGADPDAVRTHAFWLPKSDLFQDPANPEQGTKDWDTVMQEHGLPSSWGYRTRLVYANVPEGTQLECKIGRVAPTADVTRDGLFEETPGGGIEVQFQSGGFDPSWVVFDREDPAQVDRLNPESLGLNELHDALSNQVIDQNSLRTGVVTLRDARYRETRVPTAHDPETLTSPAQVPEFNGNGTPRQGPDGRYVWRPLP